MEAIFTFGDNESSVLKQTFTQPLALSDNQ